MLGQQFTRSGDHSCDKGQISTDHQLFWSLIKSTDDLWSTCDRLEPQSGELSPDPRKYSAKNGFWCNPRSSLIRERYFEKMLKVRCFDAVKRIICRIPVCCFPPQYLPCRKYIDFTQTQDFFLCACDDWNRSFSATFLPVFCVYLGMLIQGVFFTVPLNFQYQNETLPKAQRTRGLSSSYQNNFFRSHHKYQLKHRKNCECCPGHYLSTSVY